MNREEVFEAWAPRRARWTPWVKPVLFSYVEPAEPEDPPPPPDWLVDVTPDPLDQPRVSARSRDVAFVLDLPAVDSIRAAIALDGFFPVPLFTALPHPLAVIPMDDALALLASFAHVREKDSLTDDAPPVFLLDARRNARRADPGRFDNRSVVFDTDFPSADRLVESGIRKVIVVQTTGTPAVDLVATLVAWQTAGLAIFSKRLDSKGPPKPIEVRPPSIASSAALWLDRLLLARDATGAFGKMRPSSS